MVSISPCRPSRFGPGSRTVSVFEWRERYFSGTEMRQRHPGGLDGRHLAWMFNRTLEAIGFLHSLGWVHGAVLQPHLLFHTTDHGLRLAGWTHAQRCNRTLRIVSRGFKAW